LKKVFVLKVGELKDCYPKEISFIIHL